MARRKAFTRVELLHALDVRYKQLQAEELSFKDQDDLARIFGAKEEVMRLEQAIRLGTLPGEVN